MKKMNFLILASATAAAAVLDYRQTTRNHGSNKLKKLKDPEKMDAVDQASYDSFPASDPPAW